MKCPKCKTEVSEPAVFCPECGANMMEAVSETADEIKAEINEAETKIADKVSDQTEEVVDLVEEKAKEIKEEVVQAVEEAGSAAVVTAAAPVVAATAPSAEDLRAKKLEMKAQEKAMKLKKKEEKKQEKARLVSSVPKELKPFTTAGAFWYMFLLSVPIIGFIAMLIFAFASKNVNRKSVARAVLIALIIGIIISIGVSVSTYFIFRDTIEEIAEYVQDNVEFDDGVIRIG
ncbi:MAG: zinc ribbon domain-containing protein [Clostridiaceae bacterium]|nr:zinc ribbon domain-containing protein [Clostridiaceae bacterium]